MTRNRNGLAAVRWGSHLPILTKYLWSLREEFARTPKACVLEHGAGFYSSPIIDKFCKDMSISRVVIEEDVQYVVQFVKDGCIYFRDIESFGSWLSRSKMVLLFALIDGSQHTRQPLIQMLGSIASKPLLVVHDTDMMELYNYDFSGHRIVEEYRADAHTTVIQRS